MSYNKNNVVLWYALWRVTVGLHVSITYGFMISGHTKFSPDWHFGLWKSKRRYCNAETLEEVAETVRLSSRSGHNTPHLIGDPNKPVVFYDWKSFLSLYFRPLKNFTKYHHFSFSATRPGMVMCKVHADSVEEQYNLIRRDIVVNTSALPEVINMKGLDAERQWYLYKEIRNFYLNDRAKDITCPKIPLGFNGFRTLNEVLWKPKKQKKQNYHFCSSGLISAAYVTYNIRVFLENFKHVPIVKVRKVRNFTRGSLS